MIYSQHVYLSILFFLFFLLHCWFFLTHYSIFFQFKKSIIYENVAILRYKKFPFFSTAAFLFQKYKFPYLVWKILNYPNFILRRNTGKALFAARQTCKAVLWKWTKLGSRKQITINNSGVYRLCRESMRFKRLNYGYFFHTEKFFSFLCSNLLNVHLFNIYRFKWVYVYKLVPFIFYIRSYIYIWSDYISINKWCRLAAQDNTKL